MQVSTSESAWPSGGLLVVGAPAEDNGMQVDSGAAYAFDLWP
jgi:hypothetical protein